MFVCVDMSVCKSMYAFIYVVTVTNKSDSNRDIS